MKALIREEDRGDLCGRRCRMALRWRRDLRDDTLPIENPVPFREIEGGFAEDSMLNVNGCAGNLVVFLVLDPLELWSKAEGRNSPG